MTNKGNLFIVSGPSGSGKDTVLQKVFEHNPDIKFSISTITRPMRAGETPDGKYRFVSREKFEDMLKNDELLEHNVFVGNYYGTPKQYVLEQLENGYDCIVEVDVNGAAQIKEKIPESISIFICPPSFEVLKDRLSGRGSDSPEAIEERFGEAVREIKCAPEYDYIVVNDVLDKAVEDVISIIEVQNLKSGNNLNVIDNIVNM